MVSTSPWQSAASFNVLLRHWTSFPRTRGFWSSTALSLRPSPLLDCLGQWGVSTVASSSSVRGSHWTGSISVTAVAHHPFHARSSAQGCLGASPPTRFGDPTPLKNRPPSLLKSCHISPSRFLFCLPSVRPPFLSSLVPLGTSYVVICLVVLVHTAGSLRLFSLIPSFSSLPRDDDMDAAVHLLSTTSF